MSTPFASLTGALPADDWRSVEQVSARLDPRIVADVEPPAAVELDATGRAYYAELIDALRVRDSLDELIDAAKARLQELAGDATELRLDGRPVFTYKPHTRREFSTREAKRFLTAEQIEACTVERTVRPFRRAEADA